MRERESNYDLLRGLAAASVVLAHVSASFVETFVWDYWDGIPGNHPLVSCVYTTLPRFSVPVFLMLSGAFLLGDERTGDFRSFYQKALKRVAVPAVIAIVFACVYNFITLGLIDHAGMRAVFQPLLDGAPFYHLWYLPVMLMSYLSAPFVYRFKDAVGESLFIKVSLVMTALGSYALWQNSPVTMHWNIGEAFCMLGYFMAGYSLRALSKDKKGGWVVVSLGVILEIIAGWLLYKALLSGMDRTLAEHRYIMTYTPLITLASLLIFAGFARVRVRGDYRWFSEHTYEIYLIHAFVLDVILRVSRHLYGQRTLTHLDSRIAIPVIALIVYLVSYGIAVLIKKAKPRRASQ